MENFERNFLLCFWKKIGDDVNLEKLSFEVKFRKYWGKPLRNQWADKINHFKAFVSKTQKETKIAVISSAKKKGNFKYF